LTSLVNLQSPKPAVMVTIQETILFGKRMSWLPDSPYYAIDMEFCFLSLADYIRFVNRWRYDDKTRTRIFRIYRTPYKLMSDIAARLAFIHSCNGVHRDLKPSNSNSACPLPSPADLVVLYSRDSDSWKIADFGFTVEGSSKRATTSILGRGTTSYRAPELIQDNPIYTQKVDIWALGCIFYEVITGQKAFQSDWHVRDYQFSWLPFKFPDLGAPHRQLKPFFEKKVSEMLRVNWSNRPSAVMLRDEFSTIWALKFGTARSQPSLVKFLENFAPR
jgi:serine/threonine protein kinase